MGKKRMIQIDDVFIVVMVMNCMIICLGVGVVVTQYSMIVVLSVESSKWVFLTAGSMLAIFGLFNVLASTVWVWLVANSALGKTNYKTESTTAPRLDELSP